MTYKTSLSERTVRRALSDLREKGLLIVIKDSTYHSTTEYRIDLTELQVLQKRPARDTIQDLPETTKRPARDAPKPSLTINKQPSKKKSRKRDTRLDHPAIIAYRDEAHLHVPINLRDDVVSVIDDADKWKDIVHAWMGKGWNKQNISGMLDVYKNGWTGKKKGFDTSAFDRVREELERERDNA